MSRARSVFVLLGLVIIQPALADVIDGEELLDPTRPLLQTQVPQPGRAGDSAVSRAIPTRYEVTFVRAGSFTPMAVVNNQRVTLGDVVGQATVVAIDRSGVTLQVNNQERRVTLFATDVKHTPTTDN